MDAGLWRPAVVGLCLLHAAAAFLLQPNFDKDRFSGTWYNTGIILDSGQLSDKDSYEISVQSFESGSLSFSVADAAKNCDKIETHLEAAGKPGKFERGEEKTVIRIVTTDYDNYALLLTETRNLSALHLYTRKTDATEEEKQKLLDLASCLNFDPTMIIDLPIKECVPS